MTQTAHASPAVGLDTSGPADPCAVCPARSIAEDSSFGYCEGCPSRLRRCPSCEQYRPQTDWGYGAAGMVFALIRWVCAGCRVRVVDAVSEHPRFVVHLGLAPSTKIAGRLARELERAADRDHHHPAAEVLRRIGGKMSARGDADVDVSDVGLVDRRAVQTVLERLPGDVPHAVSAACYALVRAWGNFVDASAAPPPARVPAPTVAERVAALGIERPT
jgi:hypothetical protein